MGLLLPTGQIQGSQQLILIYRMFFMLWFTEKNKEKKSIYRTKYRYNSWPINFFLTIYREKNRKFCKLQRKLQNTPYIWTKATSHETAILCKSKKKYIFIHWRTKKHKFNGWKKLQVWGVTPLLRVYNMLWTFN